MEVFPGIHQIKSPIPNNPLGYINAYLVQGEAGWLLVDTGWNSPKSLQSIEDQLGTIGVGFGDISQIIITHIHPDHYGLAAKIKELSGAHLAMHQKEREFVELRFGQTKDGTSQLMRMLQHLRSTGMPNEDLERLGKAFPQTRDVFPPAAVPDTVLEGGMSVSTGLFNFEVIWTPGHCPGHICLYERSKNILLSGDHVLPTITSNIGYHPHSGENPLGDYLASLDQLKKLEVDHIFPAHEYIFNNLPLRVDELFAHHDQRLQDILDASQGEMKTGYEIASSIPWVIETDNNKIVSFKDLSTFDRWLALGETMAHIVLLLIRGDMEKDEKDDVMLLRACDSDKMRLS